jgi:hypothetical protein
MTKSQKSARSLCIASLSVIALLGLLRLPEPFHGDQALFTLSSSLWAEGGKLYEDFWDLKQPAIHAFYLVGGSLFGFTEVGIHMFEVLYMLGFSIILIVTMRRYLTNAWVACLAPLFTVGCYFALSGSWHLTQIEGLVGVPIFIGIWLASSFSETEELKPFRFFLSGLMGGVVLCFKILYAPIVGFSWIVALLAAHYVQKQTWGRVFSRVFVPIVLGLATPVALTVAYFASEGTLDLLYWISFIYPPQVVGEIRPSPHRLLAAVKWFIAGFGSLLPLAFIGAYGSLRRGLNILALNLVGWVALGLGAIVAQTVSWWEYHMLLLIPPVGLLAARGVDLIWGQVTLQGLRPSTRIDRFAAVALGVLVFASPVVSASTSAIKLANNGFALGSDDLRSYQSEVSHAYAQVFQEVEFLQDPQSLPGNIYVFGNPIFQFKSGRRQAIAMNGWSFDILLLSQWEEVVQDLQESPPPYIFVERGQWNLIDRRFPETREFLDRNYAVLRDSPVGTWYIAPEASNPL